MRKVLDGCAELEMIERPKALDEGPESLLEMHLVREGGGELGGAVVLW